MDIRKNDNFSEKTKIPPVTTSKCATLVKNSGTLSQRYHKFRLAWAMKQVQDNMEQKTAGK